MRIFIITMDDPIQTKAFIIEIIKKYKNNIIGLAVSKGDRLTIQKRKSKFVYLISLLLIMGIFEFSKNSLKTIFFKIRKSFATILPHINPSIKYFAEKNGIKTWEIRTPNNKSFLNDLRVLKPDVIINQSQNILKSELLAIPKIGVINRHNALLPKNRGRLTPFWVLYKGEKETGVSIHFVTEELDAGDIIVQKRFDVEKNDNFNSIVKKNYKLAPVVLMEALKKLETGDISFIKNDATLATYNTTPTLKEAWRYREQRIKSYFKLISN